MFFGHNPNLPLNLNSNMPSLEGTTSIKLVADNLTTMHAARQAFIQSEASERVKGALRD